MNPLKEKVVEGIWVVSKMGIFFLKKETQSSSCHCQNQRGFSFPPTINTKVEADLRRLVGSVTLTLLDSSSSRGLGRLLHSDVAELLHWRTSLQHQGETHRKGWGWVHTGTCF